MLWLQENWIGRINLRHIVNLEIIQLAFDILFTFLFLDFQSEIIKVYQKNFHLIVAY